MNDLITCTTWNGTKRTVPKEKLSFRPSVYGIVVSDHKLLLTKIRSTGKLWVPGGGVELGETLEQALKRETWEECGIDIEVGAQVLFKENFFFYDPEEIAWQIYMFFYTCKPKSLELSLNDLHNESIDPQWVEIESLKAEDFQSCGEEIMGYLNRR